MISIVIPAKQEGEGLASVIQMVRPYAKEIIVVDGHSTDNTRAICKRMGVRYLLDHGLGRGDGVRMGIAAARYSIIVLFDADGSHSAKDIPALIAPIQKGKADIVVASRKTGGSQEHDATIDSLIRARGADMLTSLVNMRFHTNLTDILYSFRALRASSVPHLHLRTNTFVIEQELIVNALYAGLRVVQIPSRENKRAWGSSKLPTSMGLSLLWDLTCRLIVNHTSTPTRQPAENNQAVSQSYPNTQR